MYPSQMATKPMPVGNVKYFKGDIEKIDPDAFGFFKCKITAPPEMDRPVLQTRGLTPNGMRTFAPLGTWIDVVFSVPEAEIKAYRKLGYKFEILEGYLFEKGYIFKDYIEFWYKIKQSHKPWEIMYYIAKLMLNSLYGKFGLDPYLPISEIIDLDQQGDYINNPDFSIEEIINFGSRSLIQYTDNSLDRDSINQNVCVAISASITAYARIFMSQFLADTNIDILYTDTDSFAIRGVLDPKFVGPDLGLFKLEHKFKEATFLAPKVYGGLIYNTDNTIKEVVKVKGYKDDVPYDVIKSLLVKNEVANLKHEKWFRDLKNSNITIVESIYKLSVTENKRKNIYLGDKFIGTIPYFINEKREILNK